MRSLVEIQRFKDSKLALVLIVVLGLTPLLLFAIGWSQMKEFATDDLWTMAATVLAISLPIFISLRIKTMVQLDSNKIVYQSKAFFNRKSTIPIGNIKEWSITDHRWTDGLGYQHSLQRKSTDVMRPGKALVIKTRDGRTYKFGINRPGMVKRFIHNNWEQNEKMYG
ncbi:hypothetical protein [Owenweeksia hongkongensis]|uniref:hypothetical protein n=1 Tax=Owenweeksia hongkongensis TaxID=253245 RepID=UPI003A95C461